MEYAPIALFLYNRSDKAKLCLDYLVNNKECAESTLYIFCDGAKGDKDKAQVEEVRRFADSVENLYSFKEVHVAKAERNKGLAKSIIDGVTEVLHKHKRIIVLEDDLLVADTFLSYMNGALKFYENDERYGSISAFTENLPGLARYSKDIYAMYKGECWGWATWENRWLGVDWAILDYDKYLRDKKFRIQFELMQAGLDRMFIDWHEGRNNSWAVRWCYHLFKNKQLTIYPRISLVQNIGMDGSGTHFDSANNNSVEITMNSEQQEYSSIFKYEFLERDKTLQKENYRCCYPLYWRVREIFRICLKNS